MQTLRKKKGSEIRVSCVSIQMNVLSRKVALTLWDIEKLKATAADPSFLEVAGK